MTKRNFVITIIFFFFANLAYSQTSKWENFTDYKNVKSIATDLITNRIYAASSGGLFVVDATTGKVITKYTNLNGLIHNELTSLSVDNSERLWIGASDGSISILDLKNLTWKYIFDIKNSNESDKTINFLYSAGNFMFAATGYGIQKISATNFNFIDAPYYKLGNLPINTPVYGLTSSGNFLYAATKSGVAYANYIASNLNDPVSWLNYFSPPLNTNVRTIESYSNKIFIGSESAFYYFDGIAFLEYPNASVASQNTKFIKVIGGKLYFISGNNIYYADSSNLSEISQYKNPGNYTTLGSTSNSQPIAGLSDNGIMLNSQLLFPNGPYNNSFNSISIDDNNNIWAAGGTPTSGFYMFNGTEWSNYNRSSHPEIGSSDWFQKIVCGNGNVWAMGFGGGPTMINGSTVRNYNTADGLPGIPTDPNFCASYGGVYDINGVFWVTFFATNSGKSLYALDGNGWTGFVNPGFLGSSILANVAVDSYNTKWIVTQGSRSGVYFFNENGTLTNFNDDIFGIYDNADLGSEVASISDVIVDKNNEVWISTNNGVFIVNNPYGAIQNPANKPRAQKLGIISGNLKVPFTENCITITNDILNDKWIGTETNGVFHLSADGSTLIEQFNTSKTPILANRVASIKVSNNSGKAYFGTQKGMSSYQTNAIEPVQDFGKIIASPNPFLVPSGVSLKIDGLIENSIIKILTLSGEIVNEFDSPGGRIAFWDGRNKNNELASTGIYIIVAYNNDGSKVGTGKVALVNK